MTEAQDFQDVESLHIVINGVFNAFLSYTVIMLNLLTIYAVRKTSSLPKNLKTLFLSLAVSDLGVGLLVQPLKVACFVIRLKENTENNPTYKVTENVKDVMTSFLCCATFFGVTALTADRFLAIHFHLRYQELVTYRRVVAGVTSIWVLSAIYSPFWIWNPKIFSTVTGIIPTVCLILTACFHCKIYLAVRRHANQIQVLRVQQVAQNNEVMTNTLNTARQIKSAVGTFHLFIVFLVCYLPFISINVVKAVTGASTHIYTTWEYTLTLMFLNSSLNPLVYCWNMRHIRHVVMNIRRNITFKRNN